MRRMCFVFLVAALPATAQEPRELIERAIKAHGGADRLARLRQSHYEGRGTLHVAGRKLPFTIESLARMPGRFRTTITTEVDDAKVRLVQVLDGERGWVNERGLSRAVDGERLARWKELAHADHLATLTPLLAADKGYTLTALPECKIDDRPAAGVNVAVKGFHDVRLYFDRETGLLVRKAFKTDPGGKGAGQEETYRDFKDFDGLKRPQRTVIRLDGMIDAEVTLTSLHFPARIDDKDFARPE